MLAASDDPSVPESKKLSDTEVLAQSIIFLAAGYETSSGTLSLTCYHIATNADVQDKLQQEIDSVWTDEEQLPTYETVNELPYLDMVISETLRLYPPGKEVIEQIHCLGRYYIRSSCSLVTLKPSVNNPRPCSHRRERQNHDNGSESQRARRASFLSPPPPSVP